MLLWPNTKMRFNGQIQKCAFEQLTCCNIFSASGEVYRRFLLLLPLLLLLLLSSSSPSSSNSFFRFFLLLLIPVPNPYASPLRSFPSRALAHIRPLSIPADAWKPRATVPSVGAATSAPNSANGRCPFGAFDVRPRLRFREEYAVSSH